MKAGYLCNFGIWLASLKLPGLCMTFNKNCNLDGNLVLV